MKRRLIVAAAFLAALWLILQWNKPPQTLREANVRLARSGLYVLPSTGTVTAANREITADEANLLTVSSDWTGVIRVSADDVQDTEGKVKWGKLWVWGDPALIKRLSSF